MATAEIFRGCVVRVHTQSHPDTIRFRRRLYCSRPVTHTSGKSLYGSIRSHDSLHTDFGILSFSLVPLHALVEKVCTGLFPLKTRFGDARTGASTVTTHTPEIGTLNPLLSTPNSEPSTLNPQHTTLNPQPSTLNPQPSTLNTQPSNLKPQP